MKNRLLSIIKGSIPYIKELRPIAGSVTAVILWQQLDYWFEKYPDGYYKFLSPPENAHPSYKTGDSWCEELGFSKEEFRCAFDKIGVRHSSKTAFNKVENPFLKNKNELFFASYQDKLKKMTFYYRNHDLADKALTELVTIKPKPKRKTATENETSQSIVDKQTQSTIDDETQLGEIGFPNLPTSGNPIYPGGETQSGVTEITSEITSETTAAESNLSNEELNCFEWAKKEPYWSKLVYSEKAFLKHYRSESQALKGQYQNWLEIQQAEAQKNAPKKSAPARPTWQLQGFKTEQEYNAAHLQKLKQLEANMKGGKGANV
jgi:hypothetical protein